jgi:hypothetical protein
MLIASKYEEIYAPEIRDFVYITDRAYTKADIIEMEHIILYALGFDITTPSQWTFLERYAKIAKADNILFNLSRFLLEISLIDVKMVKYLPSLQAGAALYLASKVLKLPIPWS